MNASLSDWHGRLDERFRTLRDERYQLGAGRPLFALEHGLSPDNDLPDLAKAVRAAVLDSALLSTRHWLPLVVYAAEVGYRYQGDEYWPVFEEETPGWKRLGNPGRVFVRKRYERFAESYGGAVPSGAWAAWFKNIAWPITHAILPTDLQRHLARLLYDYRRAFTNQLLDDHDALGALLARRSHDTSARFRKFAENSQLLGLVAASLLLGDDHGSTLLEQSTLHRIVEDLSHERQAGAWLSDAKKAAIRVRRSGLVSTSSRSSTSPTSQEADYTRWPKLEAELSVRRTQEGWRAYLAVPSHESIAQRFPELRQDLERVRYRLSGASETHPRGALMFRRGPVPLIEWPRSNESVIEAESASEALRQQLVDSCRMSGDPWLFHLREPGVGTEVRTNAVRPGEKYVLISNAGRPLAGSQLCKPATLLTADASAVLLTMPTTVDAETIDELRQLGVGVVSDLQVWPAGFVPAEWDGDGRASWPAGEDPIVGIFSSRRVATCVVTTQLEFARLSWPTDDDILFVQLSGLSAGNHQVDIALVEPELDRPIAEGRLLVRILEPADSSSNLGARQGLQVLSLPPRPTLEEIWSGEAAVVADGPTGEKVQFSVALMTRGGRQTLATVMFSSALPVDQARWLDLFRGARGSDRLVAAYDDAEELVVTASSSILGSTEVRAQRPYAPLRWCVGSDRDGPYARLIDHVDGDDLTIEYFDVRHPAEAKRMTLDGEDRVRTSNGGLVVAKSSGLTASVVLPPHITGGLESLERLNVRPSLLTGSRSSQAVKKMVELSHLWTRAAIPANTYAELLVGRLNDAIVARLGGLIGGQHWWEIEHDVLYDHPLSDRRLIDAVGRFPIDYRAAVELLNLSRRIGTQSSARSGAFAAVIDVHTSGRCKSLAESILRLASAPGSLVTENPSTELAIDEVLAWPVSFRLARLYVIAIAMSERSSSSPATRSWTWD